MERLSVVVITLNEEKNIERCLRSLRWADEIVVVDSFSRDRTVELARKYADSIIEHEYDGDIPQRERGFAAASGTWLMYVDADEEVSDGLKDEILGVLTSRETRDGYEIPRKVFMFGTWVKHGGWYPDYTFRLFRRDRYRALQAEVHGGFTVDGETGRLSGLLNHYTYDSIAHYLSKMNDYTSLQISGKIGGGGGRSAGARRLILSPLSHFLRKYVSKQGYRDGFRGFLLASLGAIYTLALYSKLWEYGFRDREGRGVRPPITNPEVRRLKGL
ncbi:MAG: glycosyltransferase family 2 protein [Ignavibacteria bacterium]|nr:MAG: glycosyltransferase family 2 protein [Ignavibacteria bacterium]